MIPSLNEHELIDPKGLYAALWPYRLSAMAFGHCNVASKKIRAIYVILMVAVSSLISYFVNYEVLKGLIRNRKSGVEVVFACSGFLMQVIMLPMHTVMWFFSGRSCFMEVVASLTLMDRELAEMSGKNLNLRIAVIRQIVCLILAVILVTALVGFHHISSQQPISWSLFSRLSVSHYSGMVNTVLMSFFGNMVFIIGEHYALVNCVLKQIGSNVQRESIGNLPSTILDEITLAKKLRIIHRKLFFLSRKIMEAFAPQAFTCILVGFSFTVYNLYLACQITPLLDRWVIQRIWIPVIEILNSFAVVIYIGYCCHQTVEKANGTTKILNSLTIGSEDLRLEVSSFSYQLMHYQLDFSPLGLFRLNLPLIQSMVGSVATYLVILVQMGSVPSKGMKNTTAS